MPCRVKIVGVPSEAGTHFPGQSKAPHAVIREANLDGQLESVGFAVSVKEDILMQNHAASQAAKWKRSSKINGVRNEQATLQVMHAVHDWIVHSDFTPKPPLEESFSIFVGGDCSITPAILAGLQKSFSDECRIGIIYMDGDVDLSIPADVGATLDSTGILDSMVLSHLSQRPGSLESMRAFSSRNGGPLATADNIVLFGFDPLQPSHSHWAFLLENGFKAFTTHTVKSDAVRCAIQALQWLEGRVDYIVLHFDVDVIDSGEFPLANYPHYGGLTPTEAFACVKEFLSSPKVQALILTEVNPNNDPDLEMVGQVVDCIVASLVRRSEKRS